jgi:hypothetical protein
MANLHLSFHTRLISLAKMQDGETTIIPQTVNDKGQIEGGLMSFMETELENLKALLGL